MKEIIYLDTEIMNSMLAQLDEGIVNSFSLEQSNQESETEGQQSIRGKGAGFNGQVTAGTGALPGGKLSFGTHIGNTGNESTNESRTILEGEKDILNKAFHDYALDLLTNKLVEQEFLVHGPDFNEGDLFLGESSYRFYDFNLLRNSMDHEFMNEMMFSGIHGLGIDYKEAKKIVGKTKPTAKEREQTGNSTAAAKIARNFLIFPLPHYAVHAAKILPRVVKLSARRDASVCAQSASNYPQ